MKKKYIIQQKALKIKNMLHIFNLIFYFSFGRNWAIMFAVATGTTISCNLRIQYKPVLSLPFLDVYVSKQGNQLMFIPLKYKVGKILKVP
jgi:hypothetical protein